MLFNVEKYKVMYLGYNNPKVNYAMEATQLQEVNDERDLGIIVSDDLKWDKQCPAAIKQANKILGMIKRNFVDRSKETIWALYHSLVRPYLHCVSKKNIPDVFSYNSRKH